MAVDEAEGLRRPHRRVAVWLELYHVWCVVCVLSVTVRRVSHTPPHLTLGISELYDTALWKTQPTDPARVRSVNCTSDPVCHYYVAPGVSSTGDADACAAAKSAFEWIPRQPCLAMIWPIAPPRLAPGPSKTIASGSHSRRAISRERPKW